MDDNQQQPLTTTVHDVMNHVVDNVENVEPNSNVNHNNDDENSTTTNFVSTGTTPSDNDNNDNNDSDDKDDDCKESSPLITKEDSTDVLSNSDNITPVDDHHNDDTTTVNNNNNSTVDTVVVNETNDNADNSTENDEDYESLLKVPLLSQQEEQQPSDSTSTCSQLSSSPIPPLQLSQLNSNTNEEEEEQQQQPTITTTTTTTPPTTTTSTTTSTSTPRTPKLSPSVISSDLLMTPRSSSARALSLNLTSTTTTTNSDAVLPLTTNNTNTNTTTLTTDSSSILLLPSSAPSPRTRHSIAVTTPNATLNNSNSSSSSSSGGGNVQSPSPRSSGGGGQFNFHNRNANMIQSSYDTLTDSELDSLFDRLLQSRGVSQNNVSLELAKYSRKQKILLLQMRTSQVHGVLPNNNNNNATTTNTTTTNTSTNSSNNNNNSTMSASMLVVSMSNSMNNNNNNSTNKSPTTTAIANNNASSSSSSLLTPPISPKSRDQQSSSLPLPSSSSSSSSTTTIVESSETSESSTSAVPVTCTTTSAMNESIDEHHQNQDDESSTSTMVVESNNNNSNVDAQDILFTPAVLTTPGKTRKSKKSRHQLNSVPYFIDVLNIVLHHYQTSNSEDDNRRKKKYLDRLRSLTDCLRTCDVFYVLSFIQIGGLGLLSSLLIHVIRFVHSKNQSVQMTALMMDVDIQQQVVLCISSLLDTGEGLEAVIHNPEVINTLCISLDFDELIQCTNHYETMKRNESLKHSQKLSKRRNHHHNKKNIVSSIFSGGGGSSNNENSSSTSSTSSTNSMDHHPDENTSMGGGGSRVIVGNTMLGGNNLNFKMSSALKATCLYWKKQIGIRIHLLYLLSVLCYASEEIYCVVLEAMNHYKLMKREVSRFSSLVKSFLRADVTEPLGLEYVTHALMFMNALYYAPNDATQRNHLYKEFGMMGVTQHLNAVLLSSPYPKLQKQVQMYLDFEREELDLFKLIVQGVNTASESKSAGRDLFSESSLGSSSITSPFSTDSVTSPNNAVVPSDNMDQQQQTAPTHHRDSNYDEEYQMFSMLEDPLEMTNFIRNRVSGLPTANSSFTNTIRYMMLVSMKHSDSTLTQDWTAMEDMIFQAISLNSNTQTLDVNHASPTELKLQNTVEIQYKKIKELERERNKAIALLREKIERKPSTETIDDDLKQKDLIRTLLEYFNGAGSMGVGLPDVGAGVAAPPPPPPPMMGGPPPPPPLPPMIGGGPPPPPPPPMIGGGPPPPPMMGGGPGGPPPPPMMGMGPQLPKLPTVRPKGLTKKVFVNDFKINNPKISKTLWFDIVKKYVLDVAKDINWDEIERQYTKAEKKKKAEPEKVVEQKVSFLDANQNRQISLLRGYMKIDPPTFRKAIIDMNYNVVAKQIIHTMKNLCPTDDKMTEMMEYSKANGTSLLDPGDHMFHVLGDIPRLKQKFACWSFMLDYEELIAPMRVNVECLWTAAEQMMESKTFHKLLAIILDVINFLNPKASQVYGFKLLFLTKLEDVRTEGEDQPPGNLLKTITSFCCDHAKYATMLTDTHAELNSLKNASIIEISELKNDLSKLTEGMSVITSELNEIKKAKSHSDPFSEKFLKMLTKFQSEAKDDLSDVNEALKHFEEAMKKASAAFEEKESDMLTKPHEFFKVVKQVLDRMNQYAKELTEAKEAAEKDKIKQELRKQKELEKMAQQKQKLQREMDIALKIEEEASQIMQGLPSPDRPSSPTAAPSSSLSSSLTNSSSSVTSPNGMDSPTRRNSSLLTNVGRDMTEGTIGHQLMRARQRHMRINASLGAGISRLLDVDEEEGNAASLLRNSKNYEHQMEDMMTHSSAIDTNMSSSPKPMSLVHLIHLSKHRRDSEENIDNTLPQKQHVTLSGLSTTSSDDDDGSTTATESDDSQKETTKKRSNTISIATSLRKPFRSLFGRTKPK